MPRKAKSSSRQVAPSDRIAGRISDGISTPRDVARGTAARRASPESGFDREKTRRETRRASDAADRLLRDLDDVIRHHPRGADTKD